MIVIDDVYGAMIAAMQREGCILLNADEKARLQAAMFPNGKLSPVVTAKRASEIAQLSGD